MTCQRSKVLWPFRAFLLALPSRCNLVLFLDWSHGESYLKVGNLLSSLLFPLLCQSLHFPFLHLSGFRSHTAINQTPPLLTFLQLFLPLSQSTWTTQKITLFKRNVLLRTCEDPNKKRESGFS
eukprot:TRINITY_DN3290_c0_g1_i6.p1 TRINITY_DN3290_c0_g1~~TRINITY_DN3290_c0_g1_i6.p1  ORF type:complete len:123 (-),score=8.17 TRINITY_DN3290_c0_g1_i6:226-594(-)